jgi:hypothetical protein
MSLVLVGPCNERSQNTSSPVGSCNNNNNKPPELAWPLLVLAKTKAAAVGSCNEPPNKAWLAQRKPNRNKTVTLQEGREKNRRGRNGSGA